MDNYRVPPKINAYVLKAVEFFMNQKNGSTLPDICDYVKFQNKNLIPVSNLKETVRQSLNKLQRVGLVQKDRQKYKTRSKRKTKRTRGVLKKKKKLSRNLIAESGTKPEQSENAKKRKTSDTSLNSDDEKPVTKRFRGNKKAALEDRKGMKVDLPRARRNHNRSSNIPTNSAALEEVTDSELTLPENDAEENKSHDDEIITKELHVRNSNMKSVEVPETNSSHQTVDPSQRPTTSESPIAH